MARKATRVEAIQISPPNLQVLEFRIKGTSPLLQNRFSQKAIEQMRATQAAGSTAKSKRKKEARDFDADYEGAFHRSTEGWIGIPAPAFRNACIDVCRMVGFKMTHAKMSVFVKEDGFDSVDGQPLIRLEAGEPEKTLMPVRNATGVVDLRVRPMWRDWAATIRIRFDADQFTAEDVANLLNRAGCQIGIGEGRHYSKSSNGMGYGCFEIAGEPAEAEKAA